MTRKALKNYRTLINGVTLWWYIIRKKSQGFWKSSLIGHQRTWRRGAMGVGFKLWRRVHSTPLLSQEASWMNEIWKREGGRERDSETGMERAHDSFFRDFKKEKWEGQWEEGGWKKGKREGIHLENLITTLMVIWQNWIVGLNLEKKKGALENFSSSPDPKAHRNWKCRMVMRKKAWKRRCDPPERITATTSGGYLGCRVLIRSSEFLSTLSLQSYFQIGEVKLRQGGRWVSMARG